MPCPVRSTEEPGRREPGPPPWTFTKLPSASSSPWNFPASPHRTSTSGSLETRCRSVASGSWRRGFRKRTTTASNGPTGLLRGAFHFPRASRHRRPGPSTGWGSCISRYPSPTTPARNRSASGFPERSTLAGSSMPSVNYYDILGMGRKAGPAEIKRAYKRLARKCHPDLNPGNRSAEEQFKRITAAYEVLSDPAQRRRYDQTGSPSAAPPLHPGFSGFDPGSGPEVGFSEADLGRGFSDIFAEIFSREPSPRERQPPPGQDRVHPMQIGFFEALKGLTTTLELEGEEACPSCS